MLFPNIIHYGFILQKRVANLRYKLHSHAGRSTRGEKNATKSPLKAFTYNRTKKWFPKMGCFPFVLYTFASSVTQYHRKTLSKLAWAATKTRTYIYSLLAKPVPNSVDWVCIPTPKKSGTGNRPPSLQPTTTTVANIVMSLTLSLSAWSSDSWLACNFFFLGFGWTVNTKCHTHSEYLNETTVYLSMGILMLEVALPSNSNINQSACSTLDWVLNSQSELTECCISISGNFQ